MISADELQRQMQEVGCPVTARRLTDWRSKRLLPPLASRGRGKGRGKIYFWKDPDILARTRFLHFAFTHGATAEIAMLSLVHGGFDVEPKMAKGVWIKYLTKLERQIEQRIEPGESPRDFFWDQALRMTPKSSEQGKISEDVINPLLAEGFRTIYALRDFRQTPEELSDVTDSVNQILTTSMPASRYSHVTAPLLNKRFVSRVFQFLRQGLSVTATKELIKGSSIEQFDQAISATRQIVRAFETFMATQVQGQSTGRPILEIRMLFRAILGPPMTAFFLQLIGEGYERQLRESLRLAEAFISSCEANSGRQGSPQNRHISQRFQVVIGPIFSDLKEIWRDSNLFRLYHIA